MVSAPPEMPLGSNIWIAAGDGDFDTVKDLIENHDLSPNIPDPYTYTPLHAATSWGHPQILSYLVHKGGDINVMDDDGDTPLYTVESIEMARKVIELGGNPNHRNKEGISPAQSLDEDFPSISSYLRSITNEPLPEPTTVSTTTRSNDDGDDDEREEELARRLISQVGEIMSREGISEEEREEMLRNLVGGGGSVEDVDEERRDVTRNGEGDQEESRTEENNANEDRNVMNDDGNGKGTRRTRRNDDEPER